MPAYEYEIRDAGADKVLGTITAILPVAERDEVRAKHVGNVLELLRNATGEVLGSLTNAKGLQLSISRVLLPRSLAIRGAALDPESIDPNVQRLFYREEQRLGADFERTAGMSKSEIRRVWAEPTPTNQAA